MRPIQIFLILLIVEVLWIETALSQPSLLAQILEAQSAIVEVHARNQVGLTRSPEVKVARDPKTGRMLISQGLSQASFERNGSGVVIHPSGIIVTNSHIVHRANQIAVIFPDQKTLPATVLRVINDLDIALIKVNAPQALPYVALADSNKIQLGEEIITIGSSPLMNQTVSGGKVIGIGVNRVLEQTGRRRTDLIQTTVNLYQGDSGGPLFNRRGELIGLMTAKETSADHSSFAIPSNKIATALEEYTPKTGQERAP